MEVLKFGGSSVATPDNIRLVASIVKKSNIRSLTIVVVSAFGGVTDVLLNAAQHASKKDEAYRDLLKMIEDRHLDAVKELIPVAQQSSLLSIVKTACNQLEDICNGIFLLGELTDRSSDRIVSYGEWLSSQIISAYMNTDELPNVLIDARQMIQTDSRFGAAQVDFIATNENLRKRFSEIKSGLFVLPGFIASDREGSVTTLGRGGSDYTAAIIAAALHAMKLEIWTDVSGMMTADPRLTSNAKVIPFISYQEAMELSHFGAKVIYPPTIQPVMNLEIPVIIKNTFSPGDPGTVITGAANGNSNVVRGISSINKISLISLEGSGMVGIPGFSKRLFEALSNEKINVILITQGSSEHSICVGIDAENVERARTSVDTAFANEIALQKVEPIIVENDLSIVALVGENMKSHPGISGRMFYSLGKNGINIRAIAQGSSEKNISTVIATRDVRKAVNILHEEFFETGYKQINLYLAGTGNVAKVLIDQLVQQQSCLAEQMKLQIRVVGIINSRHMWINEDGLELNKFNKLENGEQANLNTFINRIHELNLRNSVFADITASEEVSSVYADLLVKSISVVACNKIAASSAFANYHKLKSLAREYNCQFLFETNVGAGLPVIGTLNDLRKSGDRITKIEAVLSGTLNFVFNNYDGTIPFSEVVRSAQKEGYTEPDPRLDLGGTDVMRKILILAREAGERLELDDVTNFSFMPASCMTGDIESFYREMENNEEHFRSLLENAKKNNNKLKFVASYENGTAKVGLQQVDSAHDFFHLYGKDNVVLFYTDRYRDQPLVIKGAGAGAAVTASGVFADILRTMVS